MEPSIFSLWRKEKKTVLEARAGLGPSKLNGDLKCHPSSPGWTEPRKKRRESLGVTLWTRAKTSPGLLSELGLEPRPRWAAGSGERSHLGVSGSEPRSRALCTSPVRLAICFSMASMRSLGRKAGLITPCCGPSRPAPLPGGTASPCLPPAANTGPHAAQLSPPPLSAHCKPELPAAAAGGWLEAWVAWGYAARPYLENTRPQAHTPPTRPHPPLRPEPVDFSCSCAGQLSALAGH